MGWTIQQAIKDGGGVPPGRRTGMLAAVYLALALYADGDTGKCWPGVPSIARAAGCSPDTARRAIKRLRALHLLTVEDRGPGLSRLYTLTPRLPIPDEAGFHSTRFEAIDAEREAKRLHRARAKYSDPLHNSARATPSKALHTPPSKALHPELQRTPSDSNDPTGSALKRRAASASPLESPPLLAAEQIDELRSVPFHERMAMRDAIRTAHGRRNKGGVATCPLCFNEIYPGSEWHYACAFDEHDVVL